MKKNAKTLLLSTAVLFCGMLGASLSSYSEPTRLANGPLASAASSAKPNLMYLLDDSGSMQQDATPDHVQEEKLCRKSGDNGTGDTFEKCRLGDPPYMNYDFNFQYYDPRIRYLPAVNYDGSSKTSYTGGLNVSTDPFGVRRWNQLYDRGAVNTVNLPSEFYDRVWCNDAAINAPDAVNCRANGQAGSNGYDYPDGVFKYSHSNTLFTNCSSGYPNDMPPSGDYNCSGTGTNAFPKLVQGGPFYYNVIPTEFCTDDTLSTCTYSAVPVTISSVVYNKPAYVRWCSNTALTTCQSSKNATFKYSSLARTSVGASGTITISGSGSVSITAVRVNGVNIIASSTAANSNNSTLASRAVTLINANSSVSGFTATVSSNVITIRDASPGTGSNGFPLTVTFSAGGHTIATTAMAGGTSTGAKFQRIDIIPANTSYPYGTDPITGVTRIKGTARTDCAAANTCTYAEEITNFANWYAYYRTRMTMIKSSISLTFASLDDSYRVGYNSINPGSPVSSARFLAVDDFSGGSGNQKEKFYSKMFATGFNGSTPLREAVSRIGRYFAGKTTGINSGMAASPIQLSCQQNFMILSTDGYWNGNGGVDLSGSAIGNTDNSLGTGAGQVPRPLYDGGFSGSSGSLADVTQYYYDTDLRSGTAVQCNTGIAGADVCANNVPTTAKDTNPEQHMTSFTIGLGLAGFLQYQRDYETNTTGDYQRLKQGTIDWPVPAADSPTALDDLWHAAVNGRGTFFSARNPQDVIDGLSAALSALQSRVAAGAAAATSNLQPVAGDNFAFTAEYTTVQWTGDLKARTLDLNTGALSATPLWSAQTVLEARNLSSSPRTILTSTTNLGTYPNGLKNFQYANLTAAEQAYFNPNLLPQYTSWSTGQKATATAQNLIDYLRGDSTYNDTSTNPPPDTDLYRLRVKRLGDIIDAQPAYVRASPLTYDDPGHSDFVKCTDGSAGAVVCPSGLTGARTGTVFTAANDGMLHAFDTDASAAIPGAERWAFIPGAVLPNMYRLASSNYGANHRYFVDGSPVIGDICIAANCKATTVAATQWRTVLVAGLNGGGRGFYALDITNPTASGVKLLWEFNVRNPAVTCGTSVGMTTDCDLGFSFGIPVITKRISDGKWVVLVTSGYNNVNPGNGNGYLYVLDASNGQVLNKVGLPATANGVAGTASPATCAPATVLPTYPYCDADPIGLAKINVRLNANTGDNTVVQVYGGDLKGRLWRFDLSSTTNSYGTGFQLAQLNDSSGNGQPITTKPEVGVVSTSVPALFVGTGSYLGPGDPGNSQQQTIYAIRTDITTSLGNARASGLVSQTLGGDTTISGGTVIRTTTTTNAVDWATNKGWFVDLPQSGERVNVDPTLQVGTLIVSTNVPSTTSCTAGGFGYLNFFDYSKGTFVASSANSAASFKITSSLVVGTNTIKLPGNKLITLATTADNQQLPFPTPANTTTAGGKRVSWREIMDQ
ncbi:MAG: PilC/PilY family type IV pilus protein [Betaproteobacteria bacterium]